MAIAPGSSIPYEEGEFAAGTAVAVDIPGASEAYTLRDGQSVGVSVDGDYMVILLAGATEGNEASAATSIATLVASRYRGESRSTNRPGRLTSLDVSG